jgi:excisionase family DNA binding protein
MEKLLLTPEEAAELLSIGRSKLYQLLADGSLVSITIGASRRIPVEALRAFVDDVLAGRAVVSGTVEGGVSPSGHLERSAEEAPRIDTGAPAALRRSA